MTQTPQPDVAIVSAEVDKALEGPFLAKSPALAELLRYLRERYPARATTPTSEYAIAQDVMGRDASFDPKIDPAVRVRIRRLREALAQHYRENPSAIVLTIPSRSYDLELSRAALPDRATETAERVELVGPVETTEEAEPPPARPRGIRPVALLGFAALLVAALGAALLIAVRQKGQAAAEPYPLIQILPFQNLTGSRELDIFEEGLQRQLASDLQRFGRLRVFVASPPERESQDSDFTLRGSILQLDDQIDVTFRVERDADNRMIYGSRIRGPIFGERYYDRLAAISAEISGRVAGQGGPVSRDSDMQVLSASALHVGAVDSSVFRCIVLEDRFFDTYDVERFIAAYRCFERILPLIGSDPVALTSWATLLFHAVPDFRLMRVDRLPQDMRYEPEFVLDVAGNIVESFPDSAEAFRLLGAVQNAAGMPDAAEVSLRQSIRLNPGDPTAHAVLAYLELSQGRYGEAIERAQEAIRLSAEPQGYVYLPIALSALVIGDKELAAEAGGAYADRMEASDAGTIIRLAVARLEGDGETIAALAPVVADMPDPLDGFGAFVRTDALRAALLELLPEAADELR